MVKNLYKIQFALLILIISGTTTARAQQGVDARSSAMGFSNSAATRGMEHFGLNPAALALPMDFEFEFNLISANVTARNNSFNKGQYDRYFTKGDTLSEKDKQDILNSIPDGGVRVDGLARVNTIGVYMKYFSFSVFGVGASFAKMPEDLPLLLFEGNVDEGRVYQIGDINADGWGGIGLQVSGAYPVYTGADPRHNLVALGATLKYIGGLGTFKIIEAEGHLYNFSSLDNQNYARIDQNFKARSAEGGSGLGLDFGGIAVINEKWTAGVTISNLFGTIKWKKNPQMQLVSVVSDSFALSSDLIETPDTIIVTTDTSYAIEPFSTRLPAVLDVGVAYRANSDFLVTAEWEQGLSESMAGSKRARLAVGVEYSKIPLLPLRAGISFSGRIGTSYALGFGLDLKNWILDLAYMGHGSILPGSARGITLGLTTRLRF